MMMKGLGIDESMSNLTSTMSGETSISSNAINESSSTTIITNNNTNMFHPQASSSSFASPNDDSNQAQPPPAKKKRSLPGNPDPDAEVIALSPKSLLATNRFICEICNKGFQRDQNLQLHRRGHNLPWKLKQRAKNEVIRRKVYVCPEPSCVHHDPSRALGDLTGIKKHFCRKHGEKKWKCEKCSKKYAVQSDWKAHSKICGTREYRCDCGTLFSRRDSFITHRAFCDALAEESARASDLLSTAAAAVGTSGASALSHLTLPPHLTSHHQLLQNFPLKREVQEHHVSNNNQMVHNLRPDIPPWLACPPPPAQHPQQQGGLDSGPGNPNAQLDHHQAQLFSAFQAQYEQHQHQNQQQQGTTINAAPTLSSFQAQVPTHHPQMSATALLQKAAEMGVTVSHQHQSQNQNHQQQQQQQQQQQHQQGHDNNSTNNNNMQMSAGLSSSSRETRVEQQNHQQQHQTIMHSTSVGLTSNTGFISGGGQQASMLHDAMLLSSMQSTAVANGFDSSSFGDFQPQTMSAAKSQFDGGSCASAGGVSGSGGNDGMTRDFLGLKTLSHKDFLNMAGLGHMSSSSSASFDQQEHQNQTPW